MISLACVRARESIDAGVAGLGDVERLRLEDHLADCVGCAADADAIAALRTLVETGLPAGSEAGRRRVVQRALATSAASAVENAAPRRVRPLRLALGLAFAATVALAVGVATPRDPPAAPAARVAARPMTPAEDGLARVVEGVLRIDERMASAGAAVTAGVDATSLGTSRLRLGPAALVLEDTSVVRWEPEHATVRLRSGALHAQVDTLQHGEFRVATERFVVVVTGTRFSVTPEHVDVQEGSVRIESADGHVLRERVAGGDRWSERDEVTADDARTPRRTGDAHRLATARRRLSTGDVAGAREAIAQARPAHLPREGRAEAETLLAECAQVEGDLGDALERYLRVADRHGDLRAGDNALFAATKIAAMRGDRALERRLLRRYLTAHPHGRFRAEAARRLASDAPEEAR